MKTSRSAFFFLLLILVTWGCSNWKDQTIQVQENSLIQLDSFENADRQSDEIVPHAVQQQNAAQSEQGMQNVWLISGEGLLIIALLFMLFFQRRKHKRLQIRMNTLRAQINPHFFSNSLNAIEGLINLDQSKAASKYLIHFSRLTRRILSSSMDANTTLAGELLTTKHFLTLEQLRFKDKLYFDIECAKEVKPERVEIPSLIFQPYLENAIWHGIKPKINPSLLQVKITKEGRKLVCVIQDDGVGRAEAEKIKEKTLFQQTSVDMKILGERLSRFGGDSVEIIDLKNEDGTAQGTKVILRLPYKTID